MSRVLLQNSSCTLNRTVSSYHSSQVFFCLFSLPESRGWGCKLVPILAPVLWMPQFGVHTLRLCSHQPAFPQCTGRTSESKWMYGSGNNGEIFWGFDNHSFIQYYTLLQKTPQNKLTHMYFYISHIVVGIKSAKKQVRFINENVFHLYTCYTGHANTEIYRLYNDTIIKYDICQTQCITAKQTVSVCLLFRK